MEAGTWRVRLPCWFSKVLEVRAQAFLTVAGTTLVLDPQDYP